MKIAENLTLSHGERYDKTKIKKIAIDPRFQEAVAEFMREIEYEKSQTFNK